MRRFRRISPATRESSTKADSTRRRSRGSSRELRQGLRQEAPEARSVLEDRQHFGRVDPDPAGNRWPVSADPPGMADDPRRSGSSEPAQQVGACHHDVVEGQAEISKRQERANVSDIITPEFLRIFQVDAFTRRPYQGNAAAVVLEPGGLSDAAMLLIAREMNLSETAFLLPPSSADADLRIRWFTPAAEVDLCGHATVATFHAAMEQGRLAPGVFRMECRVGILPIGLERDDDGGAVVRMGLPLPSLEDLNVATCRVA